MSPNMIQAVAQTRTDDLVRAADRRRRAAEATASRRVSTTGRRLTRHRRLSLRIA